MNNASAKHESPFLEPGLDPQASPVHSGANNLSKLLRVALCVFVWALAVYQLSETTADPDLFGHVAFGQQMLASGKNQVSEIYSWTARGEPFINHEYGADLILGAVHRLLGGSGILLLKLGIGLLTFGLALRLGSKSLSWPASAITLCTGAIAIIEISFGFAARPQIFTALCMVMLLWVLRQIHQRSSLWALAIPPLFVLWINIHGGALAGLGLLLLATGASAAQWVFTRKRAQNSNCVSFKCVVALTLAGIGAIAALFCNPWGAGMVRWLVASVLWLRPEIQEWNPAPLGWDHATLFILIAVSGFAWLFSRRRRMLWELAVTGAFAVLALRSVRNAPLFAIVALALVPPHLLDALARFKNHFERLLTLWRQPRIQPLAAWLMLAAAAGISVAAFTLHKDHPLTMEVPRGQYPVAAMDFIRAHGLKGNVLTFFDWGDMTIFELPGCSPSIDGRLDACYSKALIAEHWKVYNGEPVNETVLPIDHADFALLPSKLAGTAALNKRPGWKVVYFDNTAAVLVRNLERFPALANMQVPVEGPPNAAIGRAAFP